MISRQWRGIARSADADRYVSHLKNELFPQLSRLRGFVSASILRRTVFEGIEFRIVTTWDSIDAIRQFAGEDAQRAVVPEAVQEMMVTFDRTVEHYEVVE
jgi:heme-degrading monooxygenase HmoA